MIQYYYLKDNDIIHDRDECSFIGSDTWHPCKKSIGYLMSSYNWKWIMRRKITTKLGNTI